MSLPSASPDKSVSTSRCCATRRRAFSAFSASEIISSSPSSSPSAISSIFSSRSPSSLVREAMALSSCWRSRIIFCARIRSLQRSGSSTLAFSASRRPAALSQSKMPPEEGNRLSNIVDHRLRFRTHFSYPFKLSEGPTANITWTSIRQSKEPCRLCRLQSLLREPVPGSLISIGLNLRDDPHRNKKLNWRRRSERR
ncbi:hypothetical protein MnTg02_00103 [bacterium MnTg02]|nr:hypothetical protein MnTg02_00103 [bacterium MnTg02]